MEKVEKKQNIKSLLLRLGFKNSILEEVPHRVAPSVLHVPFAILGFILKKVFKHKTLKKESIRNLKGSFYALLTGLHLKSFGYYIISAEK